LFISVVMFFPDGLAGIWDKLATKYGWFKDKVDAKKPEVSTSKVEAQAVLTETSTISAAVATDAAAKTTSRKIAAAKDNDLPSAIESNKMRGAEA